MDRFKKTKNQYHADCRNFSGGSDHEGPIRGICGAGSRDDSGNPSAVPCVADKGSVRLWGRSGGDRSGSASRLEDSGGNPDGSILSGCCFLRGSAGSPAHGKKEPVSVSSVFPGNVCHSSAVWLKGSLTVEAAVVVPLVWIVIFLVLSLNFYVHQRAWYTQIACEAVITGSGQGAYKGRNAAEEAEKVMNKRQQEYEYPFSGAECGISGGEDAASAQISGSILFFLPQGYVERSYSGRVEAEVVRPVEFIRHLRALEGIGEVWK